MSVSKKPKTSVEAAETLRQLEGIVASTMDGIISIDSDERIILFNCAAEEMFGLPAAVALGQKISRFMPERFRAGHSDHISGFRNARVGTRRMGGPGVTSGLRANGLEFPIEASISQIGSAHSAISTVILRDITERRAAEDARDLLAREVDHRAKNVLAVVQALLSLTRAPSKEAFVYAVQGRVEALGRAHSLLAQNRWEGAKMLQIIADETAPYNRPGQVQIDGPDIIVTANAVQPISLLIHELATNAVKYGALSLETGRVAIRTSLLPDGEVGLRWTEVGGPPVQEPTTAGFGTTLIKEVSTRQLGGTVDIGWPRAGMQLTVTLPAAVHRVDFEPTPMARDQVTPAPRPSIGSRRVLVVEDESLVAMALCSDLAARGWEVLGPAASIEEAVQILAGTSAPDVAVLDVNLSGRLVYPLAEQLRAQGVPFIFCTGYERLDHHEPFRNDAILRKPVNIDHLIEQLRRLGAAA
jgi:PAS domain S-box-containing protein